MGLTALLVAGIAGLTASAVGSGVAAAGSIQQGQAAADAAKTQAQIALDEGRLEESRIRRASRRELAAQENAFRRSGIALEGSPLDLLAQNAGEMERNAVNVRRGTSNQVALLRTRADMAREAGRLGAASNALQGIANVGTGAASLGFAAGLA